jgi:predicted transcriptional regulator
VLLDLDGQILVVDPEGGHWVRFVVSRVPASPEEPHGLDYLLTLHGPDGELARRFLDDRRRGVARERSDPMTTLKVGIASYQEMKARTMAVARGERRVAANEPKVWFTSTESFAKILSAGNRELLRVIAEKAPGSLDELARITGKAKSNLSRTLRTMEGYGLVRLERGERGRITPKVTHDRVELDLPLTLRQKAS